MVSTNLFSSSYASTSATRQRPAAHGGETRRQGVVDTRDISMQDTEDQDMVEITHGVGATVTLSPCPTSPVPGQASPRKSLRPSPGSSSGPSSKTPGSAPNRARDSPDKPNTDFERHCIFCQNGNFQKSHSNGECAGKGKAPADDTHRAVK
jgi:hypothetical protein